MLPQESLGAVQHTGVGTDLGRLDCGTGDRVNVENAFTNIPVPS
jgi:hypothetical protein